MSTGATRAVVLDTMAASALLNASRSTAPAAAYRHVITGDPILVSFVTITELRFGALRAGWGELRRRGLERDLAQLVVVQPAEQLMRTCAELRASCERAGHGLGHKIHEADRWITATAILLGVGRISEHTVLGTVPGLAIRTICMSLGPERRSGIRTDPLVAGERELERRPGSSAPRP